MKIKQITETTTAGAVATVAAPLGGTQKRAGSMFTGKKTNKPFYEDGTDVKGLEPAEKVIKGKAKKKGPYANSIVEGKMKELAYDIEHLDSGNFKKKYGHDKQYYTSQLGTPPKSSDNSPPESIHEEEIVETDLILNPRQLIKKDKSFVSHEKDRRDHEVEMARSDLYATAKDALRIYELIKDRSEDEGLMGWQQSYITLAADYLNSVADSLEGQAVQHEGVLEGSTTRGGFGGSAGQAQHEIQWLQSKIETLKPLLAKKPNVARQIKDLERQIRERELAIAYKKEEVEQGVSEGSDEDSYSDKFVQSQIDYHKKHGLSGNAADRERIHGSMKFYQHIKNKRVKDGTWSLEQGVSEDSGNWYVRVKGKVLKDKQFNAIPFPSKEAATQRASEIHHKKNIPFAMIKLTKSWMDAPEGLEEGLDKNVVKSIKVGNFRHDLVDTGMGWQVRIYNGDELYDTGMSKNSEQKGLAALEDAVAYTENQTRTKRQGVSEGAPKLLKQEMPLVRHIEKELAQHGYEKGTPEYDQMFKHAMAMYRKFGNVDVIKRGMAEGSDRDMTDELKAELRKSKKMENATRYYYYDQLLSKPYLSGATSYENFINSAAGIQWFKKHKDEIQSFADGHNKRFLTNYKVDQPNQGFKEGAGVLAGGMSNFEEEKQRLDPKCWTGYKKQGTKMKGGVRVNNCVKK